MHLSRRLATSRYGRAQTARAPCTTANSNERGRKESHDG
jgi:hypothetical protein